MSPRCAQTIRTRVFIWASNGAAKLSGHPNILRDQFAISLMPQTLITLAQATKLRTQRYRHTKLQRLQTPEAIRQFVDDVGLCLLFPAQGLELPNVYQAVAGFQKTMTAKHDDAAISLTWSTKDQTLNKRWWYYGKLLKSKATLVSLDLLPNFYALSENYGDPDDYLTEYEAGTLSADAKNIYVALLQEGPMHTIDLKRKVGLYGDAIKSKFDKAILDLQMGLKILPVGVAEAGAWRYAFIYDLLWRWLPKVPPQAQKITRGDARATILERHLRNVIYATPKELTRIFGWSAKDVQAAVQRLVDEGSVTMDVTFKGMKETVVLIAQPDGE